MPVSAACPRCKTALTLPDSAVGTVAQCPKCGQSFQLRLQQGTPAPTPPLPPIPTPSDTGIQRRPGKAPPPPVPAAPEPVIRAPRRPQRSSSGGLLVAVVVALVLLVLGGAAAGLAWWSSQPFDDGKGPVVEGKEANTRPPQKDRDKPPIKKADKAGEAKQGNKPPDRNDGKSKPDKDPVKHPGKDPVKPAPPPPPPPPPEDKTPRPTPPPVVAGADDPSSKDGVEVARLKLETNNALPCLCWDADGKAFFYADATGFVLRLSASDFKEQARLDLKQPCGWIALSSAGLVVTAPKASEVWVVEPASLKVKRKIAIPAVRFAVAVPSSDLAVAVTPASASVLDVDAGKVLASTKGKLDLAALSPDGKTLFAEGGIERLQRFKVDREGLQLEESSDRIAFDGRSIAISPDGKFVCLPSGGGNYGSTNYATYIYASSNLKKPLLKISAGLYPRCVAFDPKTRAIYAQNYTRQLVVFDQRGVQQRAYQLNPVLDWKKLSATEKQAAARLNHEARHFLVHPEGQRVLVMTGSHLYHVRLLEK